MSQSSEDVAMPDQDWLAEQFEAQRTRLRGVAYRMLGSLSEADDAVQESWLRLSRSDSTSIENLNGWLTTVVARVCLSMLRSRRLRREDPSGVHLPDPIVTHADGSADPERAALLADSVGLALLVILETLGPDERLAFVLHDMLGLPFEEIAPIVGRSPAAARQLASRARRRVQGSGRLPDRDVARQREVVEAFVAAVRSSDMDALIAILHPDVIVRNDRAPDTPRAHRERRGAHAVAEGALRFSNITMLARPALINGAPGLVAFDGQGRPYSLMAFTVVEGRIVEIDILTDPARLARLDLARFK